MIVEVLRDVIMGVSRLGQLSSNLSGDGQCHMALEFLSFFLCLSSLPFGQGNPPNPRKRKKSKNAPQKERKKKRRKSQKQGKGDQERYRTKRVFALLTPDKPQQEMARMLSITSVRAPGLSAD